MEGNIMASNNGCALSASSLGNYLSDSKAILWGIGMLAAAFPIIPLCYYIGRPDLERGAFFATGTILIVIKVRWDIHRKLWFWSVMILFAFAHVSLIIVTARLIEHVPIPFLFFPVVVDMALMFTIIRALEMLKSRHELKARRGL